MFKNSKDICKCRSKNNFIREGLGDIMKKVIADYVEREDIDLLNKLDNLCGHGQISNRVFEVCNKKEMFE